MLWSLGTRVTLTSILLVLLTAGSLMWFGHQDTIASLYQGERRALNNIMELLEHNLTLIHQGALQERINELDVLRVDLTKTSDQTLESFLFHNNLHIHDNLQALKDQQARLAYSVLFLRQQANGAWYDVLTNQPYSGLGNMYLTVLPSGEGTFFIENTSTSLENESTKTTQSPHTVPPQLVRIKKQAGFATVVSSSLESLNVTSEAYRNKLLRLFKEQLMRLSVHESGFAALVDNQGNLLVGSENTNIPEAFQNMLKDNMFTAVQRRVTVLSASTDADASELFFLFTYFRPLQWHIVLAVPLDELESPASMLIAKQLMITAIITAGGLILGILLAMQIARPVRRLTAAVKILPKTDILTLDPNTFTQQLPKNRKDEVGELARAFSFTVGELHNNVVRLVEFTTLRERLESELQVARDIQYGILPRAFTKHAHVDLYASMKTAKEVGGDLYDFFFLDERHLCFVLGDVSDKSVPAALFMSMTVTLIRAYSQHNLPPNEVMAKVNDTLAKDNPRNMFVTIVIAILDLETGTLTWTSAGHMPPIKITPEGACNLEMSGDMMIGVFEDVEFKLLEHTLQSGETFFLYTDGVSEAMNKERELFGEERLLEQLSPLYNLNAQEISDHVYCAVEEHAAGAEQSDDIAILVVKYLK